MNANRRHNCLKVYYWILINISIILTNEYSAPQYSWWRHQMETFSALLALCEGNPPATGGFPSQRPVTRSFDVFFNLRLNKCLGKQSIRRRFETPSRSLWRDCIVSESQCDFFNCRIYCTVFSLKQSALRIELNCKSITMTIGLRAWRVRPLHTDR